MGLVYLGIGCVFGLFTAGQIGGWVAGEMNYYRPHACECLQCFHETKKAPDGRVYCAEFPPKDIKMSGISGVRYMINQFMGGICGLFGLVFAGMSVFFGGRWLIGSGGKKPLPVWLKRMLVLTPFVTVAAPVLVRLFLWPLGFFSIG
jgi:hypothetical protein